jgi:CHRD domain
MPRFSQFALVTLLLLAFAGAVFGQTFGAVLTPGQEVPPTTATGYGTATVTIDPTHTSVTITITVSGLGSTFTGAHIHKAPVGVAAGIVVNFLPGVGASFTNGKLTATSPVDQALGTDIAAHPDQYYANVHTPTYPGGAIRGQLANATGNAIFAGELRSTNEPNNASTSPAVGAYVITIDPNNNVLTWEINTGGLQNPTLGHIHKGAAGANASPVVTFATSNSAFSGNRLKGSVAAPDAATVALFADIIANPSNYYVNVHSTEFPGGAIRSQMAAANEYDVPVSGKVPGAALNNFVTDLRIFNSSFDTTATPLVEYFTGAANTNASATVPVSIPPRGTAVLDDINGPNFLNAAGTVGGLRVTSPLNLVVTSRIYDDQRANGNGTLGQFFPGIPHGNALRSGVIPELTNTSAFRTNIGFFNPTTSIANVRIELRDSANAVLGTSTINLGSYQQQQQNIGAWFPGVDFSNRPNMTLTFNSNVAIHAYGSVIDNTSRDQVGITAQNDPGVSTAP